jgi:hydrogenase expression/formation protein HypD
MRHLTEYRDAEAVRRLAAEITRLTTRPWTIMEVCGGQTHSLIRNGIDQLLPTAIEMIHGPGCPVCVTPVDVIDRAMAIARRPEVILCSFGDMLRVPGSQDDLLRAKAAGADVRVIYSPLDAVRIATTHANREVVLLAIGFETTAPAHALAVKLARQCRLTNFSMLVAHVLVPPAMAAIMQSPDNRVQAFLAAGHVCSVMGTAAYRPLASHFRVPIVVTGFEPVDLLTGILLAVAQLEAGRHEVENAYPRVVMDRGNSVAQDLLAEVFRPVDQNWRGLGVIPESGWQLTDGYREFDATLRFPAAAIPGGESPLCRSGDVLTGILKPHQCPAYARGCTPRTPLGPTMVSDEGACAAYYHAGRTATFPR